MDKANKESTALIRLNDIVQEIKQEAAKTKARASGFVEIHDALKRELDKHYKRVKPTYPDMDGFDDAFQACYKRLGTVD